MNYLRIDMFEGYFLTNLLASSATNNIKVSLEIYREETDYFNNINFVLKKNNVCSFYSQDLQDCIDRYNQERSKLDE